MGKSCIQPRGMPARFTEGMPDDVRRAIVDIIKIEPEAPLAYDVVFREVHSGMHMAGCDFGRNGERGCHFFLNYWDMRAYRESQRRRRAAWRDLPEATREAIQRYVREN